MTHWLLLATWVWPLLLALPASGLRLRGDWSNRETAAAPARHVPWVALGALPALAAAALLPLGTELALPWLFLGTFMGLDETSRMYLAFTSLVWLAAGAYAAFGERGSSANRGRFDALFLSAMAGNLWLIVGQDLFSFYVGFAMMGIASYGLVIHDGTVPALRAGKVYLVMALLGEVALFAGLVLLTSDTGTTRPSPVDLTDLSPLTIGLLLAGLGVKAGMVPLHLWLPLAHPAAPVAASAVLSGTMIKVALLGWIRFLPVGAVALTDWGEALTLIGLATMALAVPVGLVQRDPKTILAYSSIAKMGLLMLVLGLALAQPDLAPLGVAGVVVYAAQHGLAKGGLFLGVGMRKHAAARGSITQALILAALVFLALALAGAPLTSGAAAKYALKPAVEGARWAWISTAVAIASVATTLLMARFIWVISRTEPHDEPAWVWPVAAWSVLIALVALFPFAVGEPESWLSNADTVGVGVGIAAVVALFAAQRPHVLAPLIGLVPPGDLLALIGPLLAALQQMGRHLLDDLGLLWRHLDATATALFMRLFGSAGGDSERGLRQWPVAGALWVGIAAALLILLLAQQPLVAG